MKNLFDAHEEIVRTLLGSGFSSKSIVVDETTKDASHRIDGRKYLGRLHDLDAGSQPICEITFGLVPHPYADMQCPWMVIFVHNVKYNVEVLAGICEVVRMYAPDAVIDSEYSGFTPLGNNLHLRLFLPLTD